METKKRKSVTRKSPSQKKKTGLPKCPSALAKAMKLISKVPLDREWLETGDMEIELGEETVRLADVIQERFPELPVNKWRKTGAFTVVREYHHLTTVRNILHDITHVRLWKYHADFWGEGHVHTDWPKAEAQLAVDTKTFKIVLAPRRDPLINTFLGVDVRYVRACLICRRVFWARREKSITCGTRCDATRRQRLRRAEERQYVESGKKKKLAKATQTPRT